MLDVFFFPSNRTASGGVYDMHVTDTCRLEGLVHPVAHSYDSPQMVAYASLLSGVKPIDELTQRRIDPAGLEGVKQLFACQAPVLPAPTLLESCWAFLFAD